MGTNEEPQIPSECKKTLLLWDWLDTGTSYPERLNVSSILEDIQHIIGHSPGLWAGVGLDDLRRSLPTSTILWFCNKALSSWKVALYMLTILLVSSLILHFKNVAISSIWSSNPCHICSLQVNSRSTIPLQQHISCNKYQILLKCFTLCIQPTCSHSTALCCIHQAGIWHLRKKKALSQQGGWSCPVPTCQNKSGYTSSSPLDLNESSVYYLGNSSHNLVTIVLWLKRVKWVENVFNTYYIFLKGTSFPHLLWPFLHCRMKGLASDSQVSERLTAITQMSLLWMFKTQITCLRFRMFTLDYLC